MRIYFTADDQAEEKLQDRFSTIIETLSKAGVFVLSNLFDKNLSGFSSADLERINQSGELILEKIDAMIVEGTKPVEESGYLIALALTYQKPILYLMEKGKLINKNLAHLQKDKKTAQLFKVKEYRLADLEKILLEFLEQIEKGEGREIPNIKFTLRITPGIERYLQWKTLNTKISKADFLRELIERLIDDDEKYKKYSDKQ